MTQGRVLTWTRLERPPPGFAPGRVLALVEAGSRRRYAVWSGEGEPRIDGAVELAEAQGGWVAR
jgi:monoamine oxidase